MDKTKDILKIPKKFIGQVVEFKSDAPNNIFMSSLLIIVLAMEVCGAIISAYDSDIWFILASGKDVFTSGVPYINTFEAYEYDMNIIIQQWLYGLFTFLVYNFLGTSGLYALTTIFILLFIFVCFSTVKELRGSKSGMEIILIFALMCFPGLAIYITMRPHILTMTIYVLIILLCEKAKRANNKLYLLVIPVLVAFHVNIHMAMAVLDPFILSYYALISLFDNRRTNKTVTITLAACLFSFVALLINPYGIDGALYVVKSYGYASYRGAIIEMAPITLANPFEIFLFAFGAIYVIYTLFYVRKNGIKAVLLNPLHVFALVFWILSMMNLRNEWVFFLFAFLSIVSLVPRNKGLVFKRPFSKFVDKAALISSVAVSIVLFCCSFAIYCTNVKPEDGIITPTGAVNYINNEAASDDSKTIACSFISGGFLEFNNMKVTMDARPEIWQPRISGVDQDLYYNYIDAVFDEDENAYVKYFEDLGCQYVLITYEASWIPDNVFDASSLYEHVVDGDGYDLYKKV